MSIHKLWNVRFREFYVKMAKYFSIIGMSVFYSFLLVGTVCVYVYLNFSRILPPSFPFEFIASLLIAFLFLQTKVRTFVKKADIVFLRPMEDQLDSYFKKSIVYSRCIEIVKWTIIMAIISPIVKHTIDLPFMIVFLSMLIFNIHLAWVKQWLYGTDEKLLHQLIRFLSFSAITYFLLTDHFVLAFFVLAIHFALFLFVFGIRRRAVNWDYLITEEEKALVRIYTFINLYMDVPQLKRSFRRRMVLSWIIKRFIKHRQSSTFSYLFLHLFIRYNDFYYLYMRLTLIGCIVIFFLPTYNLMIAFFILFITGYQLLPLYKMMNDIVQLYPISFKKRKTAFLRVLAVLLFIQLFFFNIMSLFQIDFVRSIFMLSLEVLFILVFIFIFGAKRISV